MSSRPVARVAHSCIKSSARRTLLRPLTTSAPRWNIEKQHVAEDQRDPSTSTSTPRASKVDTETHFGFKSVPESIKESLVGGVFSSVASKYDVMNDFMSAGIHRLWKDRFVRKLDPHGGLQCLDVAGGTGDIAQRILDHAKDKHYDRETHVEMLDINPEMLEEGRKRFIRTMYHNGPQISFTLGNAEDLHTVPSNSKDLYTIAFGIRNCTHIDRVLKEAFRVLKPGGVFSCLEFGKVSNPLLARLYKEWSFQVIPNLGHIVAGDRDSYQYLVESIARFPSQPDFARMIREAGFVLPKRAKAWEDLTNGIAAIHTAVKPTTTAS